MAGASTHRARLLGLALTLLLTLVVPGAPTAAASAGESEGSTTSAATAAESSGGATLERLSGADRMATAIAVSQAAFPEPDSATGAVLVRADEFADALAGAALAAHVGGPLLLTPSMALRDDVGAELERILPEGATVHLLGGTAALSTAVADELTERNLRTQRHAGPDRYATAVAVAEQLPAPPYVVLASGVSFADALAASVPSARDGAPILLTRPDTLPASVRDHLLARTPPSATIVGGAGVVGAGAEAALRDTGTTVRRVAGPDRWSTAIAIAETFFDDARVTADATSDSASARVTGVGIASGRTAADALTGTVLLAARDEPLLLTDPVRMPVAVHDALTRRAPTTLTFLGGTATLDALAVADARSAATAEDGAPMVRDVTVAGDERSLLTSNLGHDDAEAIPLRTMRRVHIVFDRPIETTTIGVTVTLAGRAVEVTATPVGDSAVVVETVGRVAATPNVTERLAITVSATATNAGRATRTIAVDHEASASVYGTIDVPDGDPIALHLPADGITFLGWHQAMHSGSQAATPAPDGPPQSILPSRGRGTGATTAADLVASPGDPVVSPVTGVVKRAGTYVLYCNHRDHYLVIAPDAAPDWEVKLLHFEGLAVSAGDRLVGGDTIVGTSGRRLPFDSQVDGHNDHADHPHLHVEVVDPSVPNRGGSAGC